MTGKASDEEAAWRDLVAQFGNPAVDEDASSPWPKREDLPVPAADPRVFRGPAADLSGSPGVAADPENSSGSAAGPEDPPGRTADPADPSAHDADPAAHDADPAAHDADPADPSAHDADPADPSAHDADLPAAEAPAGVSPVPSADQVPGTDQVPGAGPVPGVIPAPPQFRIIRPALPSPLRWQISSLAGFVAVAAFVGGFATLIMRMGDRPPGDSGPDDGAVV